MPPPPLPCCAELSAQHAPGCTLHDRPGRIRPRFAYIVRCRRPVPVSGCSPKVRMGSKIGLAVVLAALVLLSEYSDAPRQRLVAA